MQRYNPAEIEPKWRKKWADDNLYRTDLSKTENKYYVLAELAYSSGDLHMGHWFTFTMADVLARYKRLEGFNVLLPNGFDAFGLPAENAAIKHNIHPQEWTLTNIERMKGQFANIGASFDWDKSTISCLPEYYRWNQWIFLKMYEKGLAYRGKTLSSWCQRCQTVLAEENVEAGRCWRCGSLVTQKEIEQWFLKITAYANELIWDGQDVDWPKALKVSQNNWIGKSEGVLVHFPLVNQQSKGGSANIENITVFTTRPDTVYGVTFIVISSENPVLNKLSSILKSLPGGGKEQLKEVEDYVENAKRKSELERKENKEKTGMFSGLYVTNPLTKKNIPVWVADYVLPGYGTGAIMAVPAHDSRDYQFAKKFGLEVVPVIDSKDPDIVDSLAYEGEGILVNSGQFNGLKTKEAREKITNYIVTHQIGEKKTTYHLHDWSISRQRYWGTPIPIIYCDKCGMVPVPEKELPVELPFKVDYTPKGKPPLATASDWVNVSCPKCKSPARREVETMDGFVDNSWYYFRYLDPHNSKEIFDKKVIDKWLPLEVYIGGAEHTLGHALYSRFFTKFFQDLGLISFGEYAKKRIHHGLILGPDGAKMSKSKGNVVNPDQEVREYGADAVRTYLSFLGPFDIVAPWDPNGVNGVYRFLERVWNLYDKVEGGSGESLTGQDEYFLHKTIQKVGQDLASLKNNTAVAALMEWLNYLSKKKEVSKKEYKAFLVMLSPIAPHITEELWDLLGEKYSIHQQRWPKVGGKHLELEEVVVVVSINGKVRDRLKLSQEDSKKDTVVESLALKSSKISRIISEKEVVKKIFVPGKLFNLVIK